MNIPNIITVGRIILVPVFFILFWSNTPDNIPFAMLILALAGLSDILDGYLARKLDLVTNIGRILDPAADKLMVITALTSLFWVGLVPFWLVLLIIFKEAILVLGSGFIVLKKECDISANRIGKLATVSMYAAIFSASFQLPGKTYFLYLAGSLSILSLVNYLAHYISVISRGTKC